MQAVVRWQEDARFEAESGSGHRVVLDGSVERGGRDKGPRPMELVLMGVGGCSSFDVVDFLRKGRQEVVDCRCELEADRADSVPNVFTHIRMHFVVTGHNLSEAKVARAVALSAERYCSASIMLSRGGAEVIHTHEVVEAA